MSSKSTPHTFSSQKEFTLDPNKRSHFFKLAAMLLFAIFFSANEVQAQNCSSDVPSFTVDLSGNPDSLWISPNVIREGVCCTASGSDVCVQFVLTLDPSSQGIVFGVYSGAMPSGSLYYQVNCGPETPVGEPLCLYTAGPHYITFCKPGNNDNQFSISAIPKPGVSNDITLNDGCSGNIFSYGYTPSSVIWSSVAPGAFGAYNSFLSCQTGCENVTVTAQGTLPTYVDYQVCGNVIGGCAPVTKCDTVRVYFNPTLAVNIAPVNPTVCYGMAGTTITANPTGGTPPYKFLWNTGQTTQSIFVGPGTYTVSVQDTSSCPPVSNTITVTGFPSAITANAGADLSICSNSSTVQLQGSVSGASGGIWSGAGVFSPNPTTLNANYKPTPTEVQNGFAILILNTTGNGTCPADKDTVRLTINKFSADVTLQTKDVNCFSGTDGSITLNITGGFAPFSYAWSSGQNTSYINNLPAGTYNVQVTDGNGCFAFVSATINQPTSFTAQISSVNNVQCFGGNNGSASVTVSGGVGPYNYTWNTTPVQYNSTAVNLAAGTHSVLVRDSKGCQVNISTTLTQPASMTSTISTLTDATCYGYSDGTAQINASGGQVPYTYTWQTSPVIYGNSLSNRAAGTYFYTITDGNGCVLNSSVVINQPSSVNAVINFSGDVSCYNGSNGYAAVSVNGGTPGYSYSWSTTPTQTGATASGLSAGNYSVLVIDDNGCSAMSSISINQPDSLIVSVTNKSNVKCKGESSGTAAVSVNGGTSPYTLAWSTSPVQYSYTAAGLAAGQYQVSVNDNEGCVSQLVVNISEPDKLNVGVNIEDVTCYGADNGRADVTASGGTYPYFYSWSNGAASPVVVNLQPGNYSVRVKDNNECSQTLTVPITQPQPMATYAQGTTMICPGQSTSISSWATGGNGSYTYNWSNGLGNQTTHSVSPDVTTQYTVIATDQLGCSGPPAFINITVNDINNATLTVNGPSAICEGMQAQVSSLASGPGTYTYQWSGNIGAGQGPHVVSPMETTNYMVTITDECSNTVSKNILVTVNKKPLVALTGHESRGCDAVNITFENDQPNLPGASYAWSFGDNTYSNDADPVKVYEHSGTYNINLKVRSAEGCESSASTTAVIEVKPSPKARFDTEKETYSIINPGVKFYDASMNGNSWSWNFGDGNISNQVEPEHEFKETGTYNVVLTVTNDFGCASIYQKTIIIDPEFTFYIPNAFTPNQDGKNDVFSAKGTEITDYEMMIFNRWGQLIYITDEVDKGWDGKPMGSDEVAQQDVYVYKVSVKDYKGKEYRYAGNVTLVR